MESGVKSRIVRLVFVLVVEKEGRERERESILIPVFYLAPLSFLILILVPYLTPLSSPSSPLLLSPTPLPSLAHISSLTPLVLTLTPVPRPLSVSPHQVGSAQRRSRRRRKPNSRNGRRSLMKDLPQVCRLLSPSLLHSFLLKSCSLLSLSHSTYSILPSPLDSSPLYPHLIHPSLLLSPPSSLPPPLFSPPSPFLSPLLQALCLYPHPIFPPPGLALPCSLV